LTQSNVLAQYLNILLETSSYPDYFLLGWQGRGSGLMYLKSSLFYFILFFPSP